MKKFFSTRHSMAIAGLTAGLALMATAAPAAQNSATKLRLTYPGGAGTCDFVTNASGLTMAGTQPGVFNATGDFVASSDCPTGATSGTLGPVSVAVSPATINEGDSATVTWSAQNALACRYDGSVLLGTVSGWETSGYACVGVADCAGPNSFTRNFGIGGNYHFKLTCVGSDGPAVTVADDATLTVNGTTPPPGACNPPAGLTRLTNGVVRTSGGLYPQSTNLEWWWSTFGKSLDTQTYHDWPGILNNDIKFEIGHKEFMALEFAVPNSYPRYGTTGAYSPYGGFSTNPTLATEGVLWTFSISAECGDFPTQAELNAMTDAERKCYAEYDTWQGSGVQWAVFDTNEQADPGLNVCTLHPGQTYYLNIMPAKLGDPTDSTGNGCPSSSCDVNIKSTGDFEPGDQRQ